MMDIGQYHIVKNGDIYEVVEMLTGKVKEFNRVSDLLEWIEQDIKDVEAGHG
jgi:hypothetical protein